MDRRIGAGGFAQEVGQGARRWAGRLLLLLSCAVLLPAPARAQSPTLVWLTGFEHGVVSLQGGGIFDTWNVTPEIIPAAARSGRYGLRISSAFEFELVRRPFPATPQVVTRFYVRFPSLPVTTQQLLYLEPTSGQTAKLEFNAATGRLRASFFFSAQDASLPVTAGVWHRVDMRVTTNATPKTIEWQVDGVPQATVSEVDTAADLIRLVIGATGSGNLVCDYDDLALSHTAGDYPIGEGFVVPLRPSADGSHNAGTNVIERQDGQDIGVVAAFGLLDELPMSSTADHVRQVAAGPGNFAEVQFEGIGATRIQDVVGLLAYNSSGTSANNGAGVTRNADGTETAIWGTPAAPQDMSESVLFYKSALVTRPAGGWTQPEVNALRMRMGYSTAVSPIPQWQSALLEVAVEGSAVVLHRSVGLNAGDLNTAGRTVAISGASATFSGPMPAQVGVGDVLQYEVTGTYHLAFVSGRTSDAIYQVRSADGGTPQATAAGTAVGVYRAYTALSRWQAQDENAAIDPSVRDFDTSRDLLGRGAAMLVACYADGPMDDMVNVTDWTTGPASYIRIFTPVGPHLVGASQRHTGTAGTGFRLAPVATGNNNIVNLNSAYVRIEGLEIDGSGITASQAVRGINVQAGLSNVGDIRIDSSIIHDLHTTVNGLSTEGSMGILDVQVAAGLGPPLLVTNNAIYDITNNVNLGHIAGIHIGSRATSYVYNNTIYGIVNTGSACAPNCGPAWGMYAKAWPAASGSVTVISQNNYVGNVSAVNPVQACYGVIDGGVMTQSYNVSSDTTATGTGSQIGKTAYATYFASVGGGTEDLRLTGTSAALWGSSGTNLSATFTNDLAGRVRSVPWDIGASEFNGTTAVRLMSFSAVPGDGSVVLEWRTGSELSNLGFHVYRGPSGDGPWTRLTSALIPGLGSSAIGQSYSWADTGLANGVTYFYRLEDVDTASVSTFHGPVSATPAAVSAPPPPEGGGGEPGGGSGGGGGPTSTTCPSWVLASLGTSSSGVVECTKHGDPDAVSFQVLSRDARGATLELRTGGFWALRTLSGASEPSGTVRVFVPGFDTPREASAPALPLRRALVEAVVGKKVRLVSAEALELRGFRGLRPSAVGVAEMSLSWDGTVRAGRRDVAAPRLSRGYLPQYVARLGGTVFQGETKSAVVEMTPVRFDGYRQQLVLAGRVRVRLSFTGRVSEETGTGSTGRVAPRKATPFRDVLAQLHTSRRGLHAVGFEELFPARQRGMAAGQLRLQRQGQAVGFRVEPATGVFGPGSTLYFFADVEAGSTDYASEVAWELVRSTAGEGMGVVLGTPEGGSAAVSPVGLASFETNRIYQSGLLEAPDVWLWEALVGGNPARTVSFGLSGVETGSAQPAQVTVFLQGGSDSGTAQEHHVQVSLKREGVTLPLGEARFSGKKPYRLSLSVPASQLVEGTNTLEFVNLGDAGVYSLVFLDEVSVSYPQSGVARGGAFEGTWGEGGTVEVSGVTASPVVLDVTLAGKWVVGFETVPGSVRFRAEAGHRYVVVSREGLLLPRIERPLPSTLRDAENQADYLVIGPREFLGAAEPLLLRRESQGLTTRAVAFEEIAEVFGQGQPRAEAIRDFIAHAYHSWSRPSPRYVVLLGDSSYDPRRFLASSWASPLPALWAKTSYLWTVSDPGLAAVNGEDTIPDLAIGRLPAQTPEEAVALVSKVLAWEDSGQDLGGRAVLVADDPDVAGDFEADVADIRASYLAGRETQVLKLRELGAGMQGAIRDAFDGGASLMSYVGHGGAAAWASELVWRSWDTPSLQAQSRQPVLLTLNCLNGYFGAPNFESLSEAMLKVEGRGAIAAFSPSGLSLDGPAHQLHRAVMAELVGGDHERLGDALLAAQKAYAQTGLMPELLAVYQLLGDPAMKVR